MNDTGLQEDSNVPSKVYEVEALDAAQFLEVGRTRLSQLTSNGVFSFEKRKVGFRYRNFYDRSELESYVNLRKLGMRAQLRNRAGASALENSDKENSSEGEAQFFRTSYAADEGNKVLKQSSDSNPANRASEDSAAANDQPQSLSSESAIHRLKTLLKKPYPPTSRPLKNALELISEETLRKKADNALKETEQRFNELTSKAQTLEQLFLKTNLDLNRMRGEIIRQGQAIAALHAKTNTIIPILQEYNAQLKKLESTLLRRKKKGLKNPAKRPIKKSASQRSIAY